MFRRSYSEYALAIGTVGWVAQVGPPYVMLCHYVLVAIIAMMMSTPAMRAPTSLVLWLKNVLDQISQNSYSD